MNFKVLSVLSVRGIAVDLRCCVSEFNFCWVPSGEVIGIRRDFDQTLSSRFPSFGHFTLLSFNCHYSSIFLRQYFISTRYQQRQAIAALSSFTHQSISIAAHRSFPFSSPSDPGHTFTAATPREDSNKLTTASNLVQSVPTYPMSTSVLDSYRTTIQQRSEYSIVWL